MDLDELDKKIISILMSDARATFTDIANATGKSVNTVRIRLNRMIRLGIIKKFVVQVDPKVFGYNYSVVCMVNVIPGKLDNAAEFLRQCGEVMLIYEITGIYDLCFIGFFKDESHYSEFIRKLHETGYIERTTTFVVTKRVKEEYSIPFENL